MNKEISIWMASLIVLVVLVSSTEATIQWNYDSPLTVYETITDIGMGYYRYEYSFTNTDISPIWHFGVFTTFYTQGENTFEGYYWLDPAFMGSGGISEYDGRNINSLILGFTASFYEVGRAGISGPAIQVGETASGFSFTSNRFNDLPKYYFYETMSSGYTQTNGTGKVAAVGTTIPEPCTILLLSCGGIILRIRFRV